VVNQLQLLHNIQTLMNPQVSHNQGRIQKVWLGANRGAWGRGRAPKARIESSAVGARIKAPKAPRKCAPVERGVSLSTRWGFGRGLCPSSENFWAQEGEFWCIFGTDKTYFWSTWRLDFFWPAAVWEGVGPISLTFLLIYRKVGQNAVISYY